MTLFRKSVLLLLTLCCSMHLSAQQFYDEGILYEPIYEQPGAARVFKVNRCMITFRIPDTVVDYEGETYRVTTIGSESFKNACSLVNLDLGFVEDIEDGYVYRYSDGVGIDGRSAFFGCRDLANVKFPTVNHIGDYAFYNCISLSELVFGQALRHIGKEAFVGCEKISKVEVHAPTPPRCDENIFMPVVYEQAVLKVPAGKLSLYREAETWKNFKHIEEIGGTTGVTSVGDGEQRIQLLLSDGHLSISGIVPGTLVQLFAIDGRLVEKHVADGTTFFMKVVPRQTYVVKVGKQTVVVKS